jgi:hypothetical protein
VQQLAALALEAAAHRETLPLLVASEQESTFLEALAERVRDDRQAVTDVMAEALCGGVHSVRVQVEPIALQPAHPVSLGLVGAVGIEPPSPCPLAGVGPVAVGPRHVRPPEAIAERSSSTKRCAGSAPAWWSPWARAATPSASQAWPHSSTHCPSLSAPAERAKTRKAPTPAARLATMPGVRRCAPSERRRPAALGCRRRAGAALGLPGNGSHGIDKFNGIV